MSHRPARSGAPDVVAQVIYPSEGSQCRAAEPIRPQSRGIMATRLMHCARCHGRRRWNITRAQARLHRPGAVSVASSQHSSSAASHVGGNTYLKELRIRVRACAGASCAFGTAKQQHSV